jgi:hypothetical protein
LHRARSASRSKPLPVAVGGSRRPAGTVDESATGSVNTFRGERSSGHSPRKFFIAQKSRGRSRDRAATPRLRSRRAPSGAFSRQRRVGLSLGALLLSVPLLRDACGRLGEGKCVDLQRARRVRDLLLHPDLRRRVAAASPLVDFGSPGPAAREGADQQPGERVAHEPLQPLTGRRAPVLGVERFTVVEQELSSPPADLRLCGGHAPGIGALSRPAHPSLRG